MIHDLGHLVRDMESTVAGFDAHLHVGVIPFISGRLLSAAIRRAMPEDSKGLTVTIHEGTSDQLLPQLQDHTLDIVIGRASSTVDLVGWNSACCTDSSHG
jgi:DNA-binding transcriptional LysR family regulator